MAYNIDETMANPVITGVRRNGDNGFGDEIPFGVEIKNIKETKNFGTDNKPDYKIPRNKVQGDIFYDSDKDNYVAYIYPEEKALNGNIPKKEVSFYLKSENGESTVEIIPKDTAEMKENINSLVKTVNGNINDNIEKLSRKLYAGGILTSEIRDFITFVPENSDTTIKETNKEYEKKLNDAKNTLAIKEKAFLDAPITSTQYDKLLQAYKEAMASVQKINNLIVGTENILNSHYVVRYKSKDGSQERYLRVPDKLFLTTTDKYSTKVRTSLANALLYSKTRYYIRTECLTSETKGANKYYTLEKGKTKNYYGKACTNKDPEATVINYACYESIGKYQDRYTFLGYYNAHYHTGAELFVYGPVVMLKMNLVFEREVPAGNIDNLLIGYLGDKALMTLNPDTGFLSSGKAGYVYERKNGKKNSKGEQINILPKILTSLNSAAWGNVASGDIHPDGTIHLCATSRALPKNYPLTLCGTWLRGYPTISTSDIDPVDYNDKVSKVMTINADGSYFGNDITDEDEAVDPVQEDTNADGETKVDNNTYTNINELQTMDYIKGYDITDGNGNITSSFKGLLSVVEDLETDIENINAQIKAQITMQSGVYEKLTIKNQEYDNIIVKINNTEFSINGINMYKYYPSDRIFARNSNLNDEYTYGLEHIQSSPEGDQINILAGILRNLNNRTNIKSPNENSWASGDGASTEIELYEIHYYEKITDSEGGDSTEYHYEEMEYDGTKTYVIPVNIDGATDDYVKTVKEGTISISELYNKIEKEESLDSIFETTATE